MNRLWRRKVRFFDRVDKFFEHIGRTTFRLRHVNIEEDIPRTLGKHLRRNITGLVEWEVAVSQPLCAVWANGVLRDRRNDEMMFGQVISLAVWEAEEQQVVPVSIAMPGAVHLLVEKIGRRKVGVTPVWASGTDWCMTLWIGGSIGGAASPWTLAATEEIMDLTLRKIYKQDS